MLRSSTTKANPCFNRSRGRFLGGIDPSLFVQPQSDRPLVVRPMRYLPSYLRTPILVYLRIYHMYCGSIVVNNHVFASFLSFDIINNGIITVRGLNTRKDNGDYHNRLRAGLGYSANLFAT